MCWFFFALVYFELASKIRFYFIYAQVFFSDFVCFLNVIPFVNFKIYSLSLFHSTEYSIVSMKDSPFFDFMFQAFIFFFFFFFLFVFRPYLFLNGLDCVTFI